MRKKERIRNMLDAVIAIGMGVLCLVMRAELIRYLIVISGGLLILAGLIDVILRHEITMGVIKGVLGVFAISMAWMEKTVEILLYLLAVVMVFYGVLGILQVLSNRSNGIKAGFAAAARPFLHLAVGVALFIHQPGFVNWFFILLGALLILIGVLSVAAAVSDN